MFDIDMFMISLPIMLKGMAGVFCVIGIIIAITLIMSSIKPQDKEL